MKENKTKPDIRFEAFTEAWEQRKLDEVAKYRNGKAHENNITRDGKYIVVNSKFVSTNGEVKKFSNKQIEPLYKNEIAFVLSDVPNGRAIARTFLVEENDKYTLNQRIAGITPAENTNSYFLHILMNRNKYFLKFDDGAKQTNLSVKDVMNFEEKYPCYSEQKKIGLYFEQLDSLITLHQRECDQLKELKKSMLKKLFPRNGSNIPEVRFAGFTDAWEQRKLGDVANRFDNLRIPVASNLRVSGLTPYYGANGIQDYVEGYTHDGEFVLIAEDGANDLKNYPVYYVNGRIWVNNHAHVLQGIEKKCHNSFLAYNICQLDIEPFLVGGGRAKLNADVMMKLYIYLPKFDEQTKIGQYFLQLDNLITLHQRELEILKNLKKTCLKRMFI